MSPIRVTMSRTIGRMRSLYSTSFAVGSEKRYEKTSPTPSVTPIDRVTGKLVKASMPSPTRLVTKLALTTFHERPSRQDSSLWKIA